MFQCLYLNLSKWWKKKTIYHQIVMSTLKIVYLKKAYKGEIMDTPESS